MRKKLAGLALGLLMSAAAQAQDLTFIFTGTGSGSVGEAAFTDLPFTLRVFANVSDVQGEAGSLLTVEDIASVFEIPEVASGVFLEGESIFAVDGALGFARSEARGSLDMLDLISDEFAGYDLRSSLGPVFVEGPAFAVNQFVDEPSTAGPVTFTSITNVTLSVNADPVPEPSSAALMGISLCGILTGVRRRRGAAAVRH